MHKRTTQSHAAHDVDVEDLLPRLIGDIGDAIIVEPTLSRLKTCDDRMTCGRMMFGCVLIRRAVAATDMTTFGTSPQMKPPTTLRHAFNATCAAGLRGGVNALYPVFHVYLPPLAGRHVWEHRLLSLAQSSTIGIRLSKLPVQTEGGARSPFCAS